MQKLEMMIAGYSKILMVLKLIARIRVLRVIFKLKNAAAAIQAIHLCDGLELNEKKVLIGLKNAKIIGRFQIFETKPTVILDVAHNPQSIDILKDNLKKYFPNKKFHAVFGVLKDKDVDEILIKLKGVLILAYFPRKYE